MKKALFSSLIMLLLSMTMLAGSTFAWFGSNVTFEKNAIRTAKWDIEFLYQDPEEGIWHNPKNYADPKIFDTNYVYPGFSDTRIIKITNKGGIDAAFTFNVNLGQVTDQALLDGIKWTIKGIPLQDFNPSKQYILLKQGESLVIEVTYELLPTLGNEISDDFIEFDVSLIVKQIHEVESAFQAK